MQKLKTYLFACCCLLMLSLVSCETDSFEPVPKKARTYLHFLNAYSGVGAVDLELTTYNQTQAVADGLGFLQAWPQNGYASLLITPGQDSIASISSLTMDVLDHQSKTSVIPSRVLKLAPDVFTTYCLIDSFGKPMVVRTADRIEEEPKGPNALMRFMNISPNALSVSLEVKEDSIAIERLNFLNYSGFKSIPRGTYTFYYVNDFTQRLIDSIPNVEIRQGHVYSFYLVNNNNIPIGGYEILDQ
jgi:hypothetical protein